MRRIVLWAMSTLTVLVLLFSYHTSTSSTLAAPPVASAGAHPLYRPLGRRRRRPALRPDHHGRRQPGTGIEHTERHPDPFELEGDHHFDGGR